MSPEIVWDSFIRCDHRRYDSDVSLRLSAQWPGRRAGWQPFITTAASSFSQLDLWVESFELDPGIGRGESPVDALLALVTVLVPSRAFHP